MSKSLPSREEIAVETCGESKSPESNTDFGMPPASKEDGDAESNIGSQEEDRIILKGWRLYGTTLTSLLCCFLANLEVPIVSTSLTTITDYFQDFKRASWVVTSYLLTYNGFLLIWAKFSDHFGRRQSISAALVIFTIASAACGAAQTVEQLIVFRAFQGIGGSGLLSLSFVILPEMVEPEQYAKYATFTSIAFVLGFLFGPLFGGAIADRTTWRWIFFLNLPACVVALALLLASMPASFPHTQLPSLKRRWEEMHRLDIVGAVLAFGISAFLVSAFETAGTTFPWSSAPVIVLLVLGAFSLVGFVGWERFVHVRLPRQQPLLSWRLIGDRIFMGAAAVTFLGGVPFTVSVVQIPQQWQTISRLSALDSGVRLLPYTLFYCVGIMVAMMLTSKLHVPLMLVVWLGASVQTIGFCLLAFASVGMGTARYFCEIVIGLGLGAVIGVLVQFTPQYVRGRDQATAMGAMTQFRALGSVIGYAIAVNAYNTFVSHRLENVLPPELVARVLQSVTTTINSIPANLQEKVISVFSDGAALQFSILTGFAAGEALVVILMWERKLRRLV